LATSSMPGAAGRLGRRASSAISTTTFGLRTLALPGAIVGSGPKATSRLGPAQRPHRPSCRRWRGKSLSPRNEVSPIRYRVQRLTAACHTPDLGERTRTRPFRVFQTVRLACERLAFRSPGNGVARANPVRGLRPGRSHHRSGFGGFTMVELTRSGVPPRSAQTSQ